MTRDHGVSHAQDENHVNICPDVEQLLCSDKPSVLGDKIARELSDYTVAFITSKKGELLPAGSGTLVSFCGSYYVLTAAHVWYGRDGKEDGLRRADEILIPLKEKRPTRFSITPDQVVPFGPETPPTWNEFGPDIIMLRLPTERVGSIQAVGRSFYNLSKKREMKIDCVETLFLVGAPSEKGLFTAAGAFPELQAMLLIKSTGTYLALASSQALRQVFDYIDLGIDNTLPGVAKRFSGVSGGGLWKVYIYKSGDGSLDSFKVLVGVAYWEKPFDDDEGLMVRCHGPQTIGTLLRNVPK
jgi:hypothetical protein